MARHIKTGDSVIVTAGNDKGVVGNVLAVNVKRDTCIVKGVNIRTKHVKPNQKNQQGGIIRKEMPVHLSNVSPCVNGTASRVRFESREGGFKARVAVRDGSELHVLRGSGKSKAKKVTDEPTAKTTKKKKKTTKAAGKKTTKKKKKTSKKKAAAKAE